MTLTFHTEHPLRRGRVVAPPSWKDAYTAGSSSATLLYLLVDSLVAMGPWELH